jgi:hypothetical protein
MVALACNQDTPSGLAVSNGVVYWTNYDTGQNVMSVPVTGGTPAIVASNQDYPWAIAVDAKNVYWTNYDNAGAVSGGTTNSGAVLQTPIGGGTVTTLTTGLEDPYGIAVDSKNVYFSTYAGGRIKKVPIGGGTVTVLAENQPNPCYIAVSGGNVYWTNYANGTVSTVPTSGTGPSTPTVLATDAAGDNANGIGVYGATVFFAASNPNGVIWSVPTTGGSAKALTPNQDYPWAVAVDSTNVYWVNDVDPGSLLSVPLAGGTVTTLAAGLVSPTAVAVDSTGVYTAGEGGHIWRITAN